MKITEIGDGGLESEVEEDKGGGEIEAARMKAKRAFVWAGARVLFYPTLLYNVLRNRLEPEFRWWDLVDPSVLLGAVPFPSDVPRLQQIGVRGVVTLNEPYETLVPSYLYQDHGIDHLVIPTRDYLFAPTPENICRAVDFIHSNALNGGITYVHCKAGRGRSTTIVLCYLIKHRNMTPNAALNYVRSRRPRVLLAPSQWQAVQAFSRCHAEYPSIRSPKPISSPKTDEVLITAADLEGYCINEHADEDLNLCSCQAMLPMQCSTSPCGEEVFVTDADLEGYETYASTCKDLVISSNAVGQSKPIMRKLSCLFGALKLPGNCEPAPTRLVEIHAC